MSSASAGRYDDAVEASRVGYEAMSGSVWHGRTASFLLANAAESLIKAGRWTEAAELVTQARASRSPRDPRLSRSSSTRRRLRLRMRRLSTRAEACVEQARALFTEFDAPGRMAPRVPRGRCRAAGLVGTARTRPSDEAKQGLELIEDSGRGTVRRRTHPDSGPGRPLTCSTPPGPSTTRQPSATCSVESRGAADPSRLSCVPRRRRGGTSRYPRPRPWPGPSTPSCCAARRPTDAEDVGRSRSAVGRPRPAVPVGVRVWREAECLVMSKQVGQRPVAAVRRAHDAATQLGAGFLVAEVENLARWGRIDFAHRGRDRGSASAGLADVRSHRTRATRCCRDCLPVRPTGRSRSRCSSA